MKLSINKITSKTGSFHEPERMCTFICSTFCARRPLSLCVTLSAIRIARLEAHFPTLRRVESNYRRNLFPKSQTKQMSMEAEERQSMPRSTSLEKLKAFARKSRLDRSFVIQNPSPPIRHENYSFCSVALCRLRLVITDSPQP